MTDDEVIITIQPPPSYKAFRLMKAKDKKANGSSPISLFKLYSKDNLSRLNLIVAPENIVFDKGLTPYFLHYGVKKAFLLTSVMRKECGGAESGAALAVDGAFAFEDYLKFNDTLTFSAEAKAILMRRPMMTCSS